MRNKYNKYVKYYIYFIDAIIKKNYIIKRIKIIIIYEWTWW